MENISINSDKKKRGRPTSDLAETVESISYMWPDIKTRRQLHNKVYMLRGMKIIRDAEIANKTHILNLEENRNKWTVLAELGRAAQKYDRQSVVNIAQQICIGKLPTKEAVYYIRECRGVRGIKNKVGKVEGTLKQMLNIVDRARLSPPETEEVLKLVNCCIKASAEEKKALYHLEWVT
jgi:hypothetical protein